FFFASCCFWFFWGAGGSWFFSCFSFWGGLFCFRVFPLSCFLVVRFLFSFDSKQHTNITHTRTTQKKEQKRYNTSQKNGVNGRNIKSRKSTQLAAIAKPRSR